MELTSYWQATAQPFEKAATDIAPSYDVAIIGGGFTGLSAARTLAKAGKHVAVFEARAIGSGASGRNGGHLNNGLAHGYADAMARFGAEGARQLYQSYDAAIDLIEALIEDEGIACDFRRSGKLKFASKPGHVAALKSSCDLIRKEADPDARFLPREALTEEIITDQAHAGMLYPKSAMMHMGRYLTGLADVATRHGAEVFEDHPVTQWMRAGDGWQLTVPNGTVVAKDILIASGAETGQFAKSSARSFTKRIVPVGSFIVATRPLKSDEIAHTVPGTRTYVNTLNIGSYFRLSPDNRLIFGGRARFSAQSDARTDTASATILRRTLERMFPPLAGIPFDYCFGGLVDMTQDRLPRAGQMDGAWYAMGYSGHGAQMSNLMGHFIAECILGKGHNPLSGIDWPAIPGYRGTPWFLPATGLYFRLKDLLG